MSKRRVRVEREVLESIDVVVPVGEQLDLYVDELPLEDWTRDIKNETRKYGDDNA